MHSLPPDYGTIIGPIEDRMIRAVWRIVRNRHDAEDAMQNALTTIWRRWSRVLRHPVPEALVLKICVEAAYDVVRRRQHEHLRIAKAEYEPIDSRQAPADELGWRETQASVIAALARLSRHQAVAFALRVFDELPYAQIASALGCGEATARKHVERARIHLRTALAPFDPNRIAGGQP
jgi:RNA polymerase sigma factor (sigma-70 family)